jgi:hypothetical protein
VEPDFRRSPNIYLGLDKPHLESAVQCWRAESAPALELEVVCKGQKAAARVFWKRLDDEKWDTNKSLSMELNPDGRFQVYRLDLSRSPEYRGLIVGLAIELASPPHPGEEMAIRSIVLSGA